MEVPHYDQLERPEKEEVQRRAKKKSNMEESVIIGIHEW